MWPDEIERYTIAPIKQAFKQMFGGDPVVQSRCQLYTVASGKDEGFLCPSRLGFEQRAGNVFRSESKLFSHLKRRRAMVDACNCQSHRRNRLPMLACVTHVIMEQPSTLTVSHAIRRPRQPADTRRKIIAR